MIHLFAHPGHYHEETTAQPVITPETWVSLGIVGLLTTIFVLINYVFKPKPGTRLLIIMGYLLVTGVSMYQFAPVVSIVTLASGMALALATTLFQIAKK